jgi:hypothetical protein
MLSWEIRIYHSEGMADDHLRGGNKSSTKQVQNFNGA